MSDAVIEVGDKFHVVTRRLFENDVRRHFAGEVVAVSGDLTELRGYSFIFQAGMNDYRKMPERRSLLLALGDAGYVVSRLPRGLNLGALAYQSIDRRIIVTDGGSFSLPINEFGPKS